MGDDRNPEDGDAPCRPALNLTACSASIQVSHSDIAFLTAQGAQIFLRRVREQWGLPMEADSISAWKTRLPLVLLASAFLFSLCLVIAPFLSAMAWAIILTYLSWPLFELICKFTHGRRALSAAIMVAVLTLAISFPAVWFAATVQREIASAYYSASAQWRPETMRLPDTIGKIPWLGPLLYQWLDSLLANPAGLRTELVGWLGQGSAKLLALLHRLGKNMITLALAMVTAFFCFRDGAQMLHQLRAVLHSLFGQRIDKYLLASGQICKALSVSLILIALLQGMFAGIGYRLFGLPSPALLGLLTGLSSIIPFAGTGLVWGTISLGLLSMGHLRDGLGLIVWCILLVHPIDNVLRPLLVSHAVQMPFLLVLFGILGGIAAFGLIGLFLGPIVLNLAFMAWNEWVRLSEPRT